MKPKFLSKIEISGGHHTINGDSETAIGYESLADAQLKSWALSEDACEGTMWDLLCDTAGVDPERFAECVNYERRKLAERAA